MADFTFFILLVTLLATENALETSFKNYPISSIFVGAVITLTTLIFCTSMVYQFIIVLRQQRKKSPSEYRQKMRNREPFQRLSKIVPLVFRCGYLWCGRRSRYSAKMERIFTTSNPTTCLFANIAQPIGAKNLSKSTSKQGRYQLGL